LPETIQAAGSFSVPGWKPNWTSLAFMVMRETPSQRAALAWLPGQLDGAAEQFLLGEFHHAGVNTGSFAALGGGEQIVRVFPQWPGSRSSQ